MTTNRAGVSHRPSTVIRSASGFTGNSGSFTSRPLTRTWPSRTHLAACVREPNPNFEIIRATPYRGDLSVMDAAIPPLSIRHPTHLPVLGLPRTTSNTAVRFRDAFGTSLMNRLTV